MADAFLLSAARTPIGKYLGGLADVPAPQLGASPSPKRCRRAKARRRPIDEVIMGNVLQAGVGQNPARQAALKAGLPDTIAAFTVNKVCGSGLKAVMLAAQAIRAGDAESDRRRRHGEHEPGAVPALRRPDRLEVRRPEGGRCHDPRRPVVRLRELAHGRGGRAHRRQAWRHSRRPGSLLRPEPPARRRRLGKRRIQRGSRVHNSASTSTATPAIRPG